MEELLSRKIIQGYCRRILIIGEVAESVFGSGTFSSEKKFIWENGHIRPVENIAGEMVDSVLFSPDINSLEEIGRHLDQLENTLNNFGHISILLNAGFLSALAENELDEFLLQHGWIIYHNGLLNTGSPSHSARGIVIVRNRYNPVMHARSVLERGQPWHAIAILDDIPSLFIPQNDNFSFQAMLSMERQRYYLTWQEMYKDQLPVHTFFTLERTEFGMASAIHPEKSESYRLHSRFWSSMNRNDMAIRVLQSIEHVSPDPKTRHLLQIFEQNKNLLSDSVKEIDPPTIEWRSGGERPRILIICHGYSDYGLDTLYHGLCTLLGEENIVEYPWKPFLHGSDSHKAQDYPCVFNYPGKALTVDNLESQLKSGSFDFILYADVIKMERRDDVRRLVNAVPELPVILYDTWDNSYTPLQVVLDYIGRNEFSLIFKRELLQGVEYEGEPLPLPFGYPENFCQPNEISPDERKQSVFWAGKREFGLRPLYLRRIETLFGLPLNERFDQESYRRKLRSSLIGLSFFGNGFDTVRYWELPANGVMLLAERPPIHIPHNFVNGESAVFFYNLEDLEEKLRYYLNRPEEALRIAVNGHDHYLKFHTSTARARTFLGAVCKKINFPR